MPAANIKAPVNIQIVRFRCYWCTEPWWEPLTDFTLKPEHNTVLCLCDPCMISTRVGGESG